VPKDSPPHGATKSEPGQLPQALRNQPALTVKDWLPQGIFHELDELREEHHALLDEVDAAVSACVAQREAYEREDADQRAALAEGESPATVTGSAERQDTLAVLNAARVAALDRLAAFVERATQVIKAKGGERPLFPDEPGVQLAEWRRQFAATRAEAAEEIEQAREVLAKAERKAADVDQVEMWLDRTVKPKGGRYLSAPQLGAPFPTQAEREADQVSPALSGMGMVGGEVAA